VASAGPAPPTLPGDTQQIALPPGSTAKVFLVGHAKGVQIYTCNGNGDWGKSVPRADLVDDAKNLIVKHFAGPTWQATADKSAVRGTRVAGAPSPAPGPAIDWLLLSTVQAPDIPPVPGGLLTDTKFIQRVNTKGGTAPPTAECKAQTLDKVVEVPYKADYYFWK